jgi:hypothetical protein
MMRLEIKIMIKSKIKKDTRMPFLNHNLTLNLNPQFSGVLTK